MIVLSIKHLAALNLDRNLLENEYWKLSLYYTQGRYCKSQNNWKIRTGYEGQWSQGKLMLLVAFNY